MNKLNCHHADTCFSDYWGGHHLPHLQIPACKGMTLKAVKSALHDELDQGAVAGNEPLTQDDSGPEGDKWYKRAHAAVNRLKLDRDYVGRLFVDIDTQDDDEETIWAFFVLALD